MLQKTHVFKLMFEHNHVVILLNSKLNYDLFKLVQKNYKILICADGGANRLYDVQSQREESDPEIIPNIIKGDFDSIQKDVLSYYQGKGSEIIQDINQNNTDQEKCIEEAISRTDNQIDCYLIGSFGQRLDQTLGILSNLLKYQQSFPSRKFIMFGEDSILRILLPGHYDIEINDHLEQMKGAGLFPAGQLKAFVHTTGFKWNLNFENPLVFGEFVSSSNEIVDKKLHIETKDPLFLITQLKKNYKQIE